MHVRTLILFILSAGLLCAQAKKPARKVTPKPLVEAPGRWIMGTIGVGRGADGAIEATAYKASPSGWVKAVPPPSPTTCVSDACWADGPVNSRRR
ncbi:MAG: hypothetical protein ACKOIB_00680 [Verrucomicrobiota bacterium]